MQLLSGFFRWLVRDSDDYLVDDKILFSAILLGFIGLIMIYSASIAFSGHDPSVGVQYYYLFRHFAALCIGVLAGFLAFNAPTSFWRKHANHIIVIIVIILVAVLIPHIGKFHNGARRWLGVGALSIQPSEAAKLGIAIYLADYVCGRHLRLRNFWHDLFPVLSVITVVAVLLLAEPDMGSATVIFTISLGILFMADIDKRIIIGLASLGILSFVSLVIMAPYRMRRVLGFIDPWQDALGKGYQLTHSLLAVGHGGWFGVGLGNSIEKLFYLPEAHTDFIMAIIGEETGMLGIGVVLLLFWIIFYRGFTVVGNEAKHLANRRFQSLLAQGISIWFFAQALVNVGVTLGILPTKGLTLPLVSFGGSSILISCIALGILLKIDYENKQIRRGISIK